MLPFGFLPNETIMKLTYEVQQNFAHFEDLLGLVIFKKKLYFYISCKVVLVKEWPVNQCQVMNGELPVQQGNYRN